MEVSIAGDGEPVCGTGMDTVAVREAGGVVVRYCNGRSVSLQRLGGDGDDCG